MKTIKYLNELSKITRKMKNPIFRGQVDAYDINEHLLTVCSTAARRLNNTLNNQNEKKQVLKQSRFIEYHNDLIARARNNGYGINPIVSKDLCDLEVLAQIQHYGGATCLVDFTKNFLVALWFATNPTPQIKTTDLKDFSKKNKGDGRIYIVDVERDDNSIGFINAKNKGKSIEQILKIEITGEEYKMVPEARQKFWVWKPDRINNRIYHQDSIFFFGLSRFENRLNENNLYSEIVILEADKSDIRHELFSYFNINAETIYSDLYGFSREANNPREKAQIFEKNYDCEETAIMLLQRGEFNLADSYLNQATNCIKKDNPDCARRVKGCGKNRKEKDLHLSDLAYLKAECCSENPLKRYKSIAFYLEAFALNPQNYDACWQLMGLNMDLRDYNTAYEYAKILIPKDDKTLFDAMELSLYLNKQKEFIGYYKKISKKQSLYAEMGQVLCWFFNLVNEVVNKNEPFDYPNSLTALQTFSCNTYNQYWLFDDMKGWLKDQLELRVQNEDRKKIQNLLILTERIEDMQRELVNKEYEENEY